MLKFHLDENVDHAIAVALRNRGIDAITTTELGISGISDEAQLAFALEQGRVILTHDADMLALHARGAMHAGIAFSTLRTRTIGQIVPKLVALSRYYEPRDISGRVEYL